MAKYVFVTGGVVSSLGKGLVTACLGRLLRDRQYTVSIIKIDPYLNVDAGTMSPHQHGEVFVTDDGAETDFRIPEMSNVVETKKGLLFAASHIASVALLGEKLTEKILLHGYTSDDVKSFQGEFDRDQAEATKGAASYETMEQNVTSPWWRDDLNDLAF